MRRDYRLSDIIIIIIIIIQVVITTARGCLTQIPHHNHGQVPGSHLSRDVKEQIVNYKSNVAAIVLQFCPVQSTIFLECLHCKGVTAQER